MLEKGVSGGPGGGLHGGLGGTGGAGVPAVVPGGGQYSAAAKAAKYGIRNNHSSIILVKINQNLI